MIVRQTNTTILSQQLILLLLLLLSQHVVSISLSQFQQIQGFSDSCESVWQKDIPGCTKHDFTTSNDCSLNCLAGVNVINAEVLVACVEARVSSDTLLGEFLAGYGVFAMCGSSDTETVTTADSTTATATATATAVKTTTTGTGVTSVYSTTATAVEETTTQPSVLSTTPSSLSTSAAATSITDPNLTVSFSSTITASPTSGISSTTTSAKASSTSPSNTEAKGFGGVGDAFDILGGEGSGCRVVEVSWKVMSLISVLVIAIAREMW